MAKSADEARASASKKKSTYGGSSKDTSVNFGTNKFNLTTAQKNELNRIARKIDKEGISRVTLRGHADSRGGVDNMALSKNRAKATAEYLKSKVKSSDVKFTVTAASTKEPVASNKTVKGMSANRRVDIVLPTRGPSMKLDKQPYKPVGSGASAWVGGAAGGGGGSMGRK
jgi:outer membrane protein OmpA-like peptidoglycan-associated protein